MPLSPGLWQDLGVGISTVICVNRARTECIFYPYQNGRFYRVCRNGAEQSEPMQGLFAPGVHTPDSRYPGQSTWAPGSHVLENRTSGLSMIPGKNLIFPGLKKTTLISAFRQGFGNPDGLNNGAENTPKPGPLAGFGRGAFHRHLSKPGENRVYFSPVPKRTVLQGLPDRGRAIGAHSGPICPRGPGQSTWTL